MDYVPNNQLLNLSGKTAIVTGGVGGIGLGIVIRLAEAGANVMIMNRNLDEGQKQAGELSARGLKVVAIQGDVSVEAEVQQAVTATVNAFGGLDILVNNAGVFPNIPVSKMSLNDFETVLDTNLRGVFLMTKYASEQMIKQGRGGKVINITSIDAIHPSMIGLAHYDASKHGVWGFTKNVALELAEHKIWVNAIAPGGVVTPGVEKMQGGQGGVSAEDMKARIESFLAGIPMHRMGEPDDIGKVALFLASDMSSYMTGSQIVVDGGALLG